MSLTTRNPATGEVRWRGRWYDDEAELAEAMDEYADGRDSQQQKRAEQIGGLHEENKSDY